MSNSVDPDDTAHYELSHLDLYCLQKPISIACGSERVKTLKNPRRAKTYKNQSAERQLTLNE